MQTSTRTFKHPQRHFSVLDAQPQFLLILEYVQTVEKMYSNVTNVDLSIMMKKIHFYAMLVDFASMPSLNTP